MIRSKLTAAKKEINAFIRKLKNDNLVLKRGCSQSEVRSLRRLLAVIISNFRKFKISHTHLVLVLERENIVFKNQVHNFKADNDILQSEYNSDVLMQTETLNLMGNPIVHHAAKPFTTAWNIMYP